MDICYTFVRVPPVGNEEVLNGIENDPELENCDSRTVWTTPKMLQSEDARLQTIVSNRHVVKLCTH